MNNPHYGKSYLISVALGAAALTLLVMGQSLLAAILSVAAFMANLNEVKSYSTPYQFINFRATSLLLGISIDLIYGGTAFYYTIMMLVLPLGILLRLELFNTLGFNRHPWIEATGIISVLAIYIYAGLQHPASWQGWALPVLPMFFMTMIGSGMIHDAMRINAVKKEESSAELGKKAPPFTLPDVGGKTVSLADFEGKNHVLLVFVRGDWCPTCHIMIRTYENNRHKFMEKEIVTIGIGPDSAEVNREMISRLGFKNMMLSDNSQKVASDYGIRFFPNARGQEFEEGLPLPASFLVDKSGIVRYISRPDQVGEFLNPSLIFPVIEKLN